MKKLIATVLAVMLMTALIGACAEKAPATTPTPTPAATPESTPEATPETTPEVPSGITITDMTGREVTLDGPVESIVALSPADCEILYALGAGDLIVGRGEYCDYPPEVMSKPSMETGAQLNIEQVLAMKPQVIIMTTMAQSTEQVDALDASGTKVVVISAQDIAGTYQAIDIIGQLVGKTDEATALIDEMKQTFTDIKQKSTGDGSKSIYFEVSPLEWGLWTAGSETFMDEIATMLGLKNAFADVVSWGAISEEQVIERDPDFIVTIAMYFGEGVPPVDEILGRAGWENMKAIKNKIVFNADSNEVARPGPRLMDAAKSLYEFVYGEA